MKAQGGPVRGRSEGRLVVRVKDGTVWHVLRERPVLLTHAFTNTTARPLPQTFARDYVALEEMEGGRGEHR